MAILRTQKALKVKYKNLRKFQIWGGGENKFSGKRNSSLAKRERKKERV